MNNVFFTSDQHYQSNSIIGICSRPFANAEEMNEAMIACHNNKVAKGDRVYHLGDIFLGRRVDSSIEEAREIMQRLNGQHFLLRGNHDEIALWIPEQFVWIKDLFDLKIKGGPAAVLCHYALRSWRNRVHGWWHLYGHSHGNLPGEGKSFDVGVDCNNFEPLSLEEVSARMDKLDAGVDPNMFNGHSGRCIR